MHETAQSSRMPFNWNRWKWMRYPVLVFCFTRIALLAASYIGMTIEPRLRWETGPRDYLRQFPALDGLCRWDCLLFEEIARRGYFEPKATNFFPLFPMTARVLHVVTGLELHLALLVIANLAGLGALITIYALFCNLADESAARSGLALFAAYPFAFFHATGYPETLMIASTALAILLALRGNHVWAGVALGFGVLARHLTMFAGAALLVAQVRQRGLKPKALLLDWGVFGLVIPWLFFGGYLVFQYFAFDDPLMFWKMRSNWDEYSWWGIVDLIRTRYDNEHIPIMRSYVLPALFVTVGGLMLTRYRKWWELAVFTLVLLAVLWYTGIWGLGRYSASCWPSFLPLGVWISKRPEWQAPIITLLAVLQGVFFFLFSHGVPIL